MSYLNFYTFRQQTDTPNTKYLEQFKNLVDIIEQHGGSLGQEEVLADVVPGTTATTTDDDKHKKSHDRYLAYDFSFQVR